MANADRLMALSMVPPLAEEVAAQIEGGSGGAVESVNGQIGAVVLDAADVEALPAPEGPVPAYSDDPSDLADALVRAGLMQAE